MLDDFYFFLKCIDYEMLIKLFSLSYFFLYFGKVYNNETPKKIFSNFILKKLKIILTVYTN